MPALPTSTESVPNVETAVATALRLSSSRLTSPSTTATSPSSCLRAFKRSADRSKATTFAPSSTNRCTTALPIPDPAPVTTATSLSSHCIYLPPLHQLDYLFAELFGRAH